MLKLLQSYDTGIQFIILFISAVYLFSAYFFSWLLTGGIIILLFGLEYIKRSKDGIFRVRLFRAV